MIISNNCLFFSSFVQPTCQNPKILQNCRQQNMHLNTLKKLEPANVWLRPPTQLSVDRLIVWQTKFCRDGSQLKSSSAKLCLNSNESFLSSRVLLSGLKLGVELPARMAAWEVNKSSHYLGRVDCTICHWQQPIRKGTEFLSEVRGGRILSPTEWKPRMTKLRLTGETWHSDTDRHW